jgi:hypothetical protein
MARKAYEHLDDLGFDWSYLVCLADPIQIRLNEPLAYPKLARHRGHPHEAKRVQYNTVPGAIFDRRTRGYLKIAL